MPRKVIIYKKEYSDTVPTKVIRTPLRTIQIHDTFIGIGKFGQPIISEFLELAHDLERGEKDLAVDVLSL